MSGQPNRAGPPRGKRQHKLNTLTLAIMLEEMQEGPFTIRSVMDVSGLSLSTMYQVMRTFREKGIVHISGWDKDAVGRICIPVYTLGKGKNVKRKLKSKEDINRDYAQRKRMRRLAESINTSLASKLAASNDSRKAA